MQFLLLVVVVVLLSIMIMLIPGSKSETKGKIDGTGSEAKPTPNQKKEGLR